MMCIVLRVLKLSGNDSRQRQSTQTGLHKKKSSLELAATNRKSLYTEWVESYMVPINSYESQRVRGKKESEQVKNRSCDLRTELVEWSMTQPDLSSLNVSWKHSSADDL